MSEAKEMMECPEDRLAPALAAMSDNDERAVGLFSELAESYPSDARLPFLRGSMLASLQRYDEACEALFGSVRIAPGFLIARFQLGLLLLTCGRPVEALEIWGPLQLLPADHYLRVFAQGLQSMARDEFDVAVSTLGRGITLNQEIPPLNRDMQMVIDEMTKLGPSGGAGAGDAPISSAQLLLQQALVKTRH